MADNSGIASRWNELRGKNKWEGLLNYPLTDEDLRRYIIHYGRMVSAIGDVQNLNANGKLPKYEFFEKACLVKGNTLQYEVKEYLQIDNVVVGIVAMTTDDAIKEFGRRDIVIAWRGTRGWKEWYQNIKRSLVSAQKLFKNEENTDAQVHTGFLGDYNKVKDQVESTLKDLLHAYPDEEEISITVAGFSRGGAMATLCAMDIVSNELNKRPNRNDTKKCQVTAFTFASPRVGNQGLKNLFDKLEREDELHLLRVKNIFDAVPYFPVLLDYEYVGTQLAIASNQSTYLKKNNSRKGISFEVNPPTEEEEKEFVESETNDDSTRGSVAGIFKNDHILDVYLHLLALKKGGTDDPNFALVNKHLGILDDKKYKIPKKWWKDRDHNGMIQREDNGVWEYFKPKGSISSGTKRALLVGCNYPVTSFSLHGCINDVSMMQELIQKKFGFEPKHINVLTDGLDKKSEELPTRERIMEELGKMVEDTEADDVLFFHFSGHGTRNKQMQNDARFTEIEAIIPCDLYPITDMDLRHLIQDIEEGTTFTILSDSCHSGGLIGHTPDKNQPFESLNGNPAGSRDMNDVRKRFLPFGWIVSGIGEAIGTVDHALTEITGAGLWENLGNVVNYVTGKNVSINFKPEELHSFLNKKCSSKSMTEEEGILFSGCEATEESADVWVDEDTPHGAFTNAVLNVLEKQPSISNYELMKEVRSHLKGDGFKQHPCLYCTDDKAEDLFLGGTPS